MHREDNSLYLLYIEPKNYNSHGLSDEWTKLMNEVFNLPETKEGIASYSNLESNGHFILGAGYKGSHYTQGVSSTNHDYLLFNGMITNSLCTHYLSHYRDEIPQTEWIKLNKLKEDFANYKK